jgi:hypothetical protein
MGAVGDLHGDLVQTMRVLQVAGLMAAPVLGEPAQWVGGDATLVQMGDILDRGDDEIGILRLLWQLAEGAEEAGGAVYILNGNHETLNVAGDFRCVRRASPAVAARSHEPGVHRIATNHHSTHHVRAHQRTDAPCDATRTAPPRRLHRASGILSV